jgi:plasmid stability protein
MKSVQIKNVPEETHAVFRVRAARAGQSLQEYLLDLLTSEAARPTVDEVLDRIGARGGSSIGIEAAVEAVRHDRDGR